MLVILKMLCWTNGQNHKMLTETIAWSINCGTNSPLKYTVLSKTLFPRPMFSKFLWHLTIGQRGNSPSKYLKEMCQRNQIIIYNVEAMDHRTIDTEPNVLKPKLRIAKGSKEPMLLRFRELLTKITKNHGSQCHTSCHYLS